MDVHPANIQLSIPNRDEKITRFKSYAQIILIALNLSLSNFYYGYCLVYISTISFPTIMQTFSITLPQQTARGILTGCIPIGACFGALLGKKLIHLLSRRKYVLYINAVAIIVGALIYINRMEVLIIMRLIQGACIGLYTSIIPLYITELSPVQISNLTGPFTQIFCAGGATVGYLFYFILSVSVSSKNFESIWYFVFGFPLITLIFQSIVLLFIFPYQTPKYFLLHHQKKKAKALIAQIYKAEFVQQIYHQKIEDLSFDKAKEALKQRRKAGPPAAGIPIPTLRLSSKISINSALSGIQMQQPLSSSIAIFAALHLMILRQFSGINAVAAYGGNIIDQAAPSLRSIVPIIQNLLVVLGSFTAIFLEHRVGRKPLLQFGTIALGSSLLIISIGFFILQQFRSVSLVLVLFGFVVFTYVFGLTFGAVIWSYVTEIVQPSYNILAIMTTWVFASIVVVLFPILKSSLFGGNAAGLFLFFALWTLVSFVVNHFVVVQTKNKTEFQIHQEYSKIKMCSCFKKPLPEGNQMTQSQLFDLDTLNLQLPGHLKAGKNVQQQKQRQQKVINKVNISPPYYIQLKLGHKQNNKSDQRETQAENKNQNNNSK